MLFCLNILNLDKYQTQSYTLQTPVRYKPHTTVGLTRGGWRNLVVVWVLPHATIPCVVTVWWDFLLPISIALSRESSATMSLYICLCTVTCPCTMRFLSPMHAALLFYSSTASTVLYRHALRILAANGCCSVTLVIPCLALDFILHSMRKLSPLSPFLVFINSVFDPSWQMTPTCCWWFPETTHAYRDPVVP